MHPNAPPRGIVRLAWAVDAGRWTVGAAGQAKKKVKIVYRAWVEQKLAWGQFFLLLLTPKISRAMSLIWGAFTPRADWREIQLHSHTHAYICAASAICECVDSKDPRVDVCVCVYFVGLSNSSQLCSRFYWLLLLLLAACNAYLTNKQLICPLGDSNQSWTTPSS